MKKLLKNKTLIYSVMVLLVLLVATISVTYAFFTTKMDGTSSNVTVTSAKIGKVTFEADGIDGDGILPGWTSGIKNIKVTSTDTDYNIPFECTLSISNNEFSNLYLTVDGTNGIKKEAEQITSNHITLMKDTINSNNLEFEATYSLAFKETGENQNTEQDKELSARVVCSLGDTNRLYYSDGSIGLRADGIDADGEEIEVTVSTPTNSSTLKTEMEENYQLLGLTMEQASSSKVIGLSAEGEYPITMHVAVSDIASPGETVVVLHYDSTYNEWENLGNYTVNSNYEIEVSFDSLSPIALVNKGTDTTDTAKRLPSSYTRVEYIESTGTQYIDTGYIPKLNKTRWELDAILDSSTTNHQIGVCSDNCDLAFIFAPNQKMIYAMNHTITTRTSTYPSTRTLYYLDAKTYKGGWAGETIDLVTVSTNPTDNIYLFGRSNGGTFQLSGSDKVYGSKIYEYDSNNNLNLVRAFIPCYRNLDGKPGLYDLVNGVFYTNKGTGEFKLPESAFSKIYQKVEYIESTGTQYINTGYLHNTKTTKYQMQVEFTGFPSSYSTFFGARKSHDGTEAYYLGIGNTGYTYSCIGGNKKEKLGLNTSLNTKYTIESNPSNGFTINNTLYSDAYSYNVNSVYSLYIFGLNEQNKLIETVKMKLYYFKIYSGNTLLKDLIPVYRKTDNVIGLYDKVNQVFYTNAGTGTFLKGNDVN